MSGDCRPPSGIDPWVASSLNLVTLRLSIEVNRMRAIRGVGRDERFAGVLMRDRDVAALCAEMISEPLPAPDQLGAALRRAEAEHARRVKSAPVAPVLERLAHTYGLSRIEQWLFLIALAAAIDPRIARVLGYLNEDMARQHLTLALARRVLERDAGATLADFWSALSADGVLVRYGLVHVDGAPGANAPLSVPASIQRILVAGPGESQCAAQLPIAGEMAPEGPLLVTAERDIDALVAVGGMGPAWLSDTASVGQVQALGLLAALHRQAQIVSGCDELDRDARRRLARGLGRLSILITRRPALWTGFGTPFRGLHAPPTKRADRAAFWSGLLGATVPNARRADSPDDFPDDSRGDLPRDLPDDPPSHAADCAPGQPRQTRAALLADQPQLAPGRLWRLALEADRPAELVETLRHERSEPMHGLAERIRPRFDFDDLVLPSRARSRLRAFAARRRDQARVLEDWGLGAALGAERGAIALFLGPSGTGKTMAASVVAAAARLDLWRINLATVVSKYIGETEANLDRVFSAADRADVMLFFDEAEALFSKRAEVKEARDRYANMEMAYLLQRIEDFRGMAVLASNMGGSLEPAMLRRFDLVLEFPMPDREARRALWARIENTRAPLAGDVDLDDLAARFELAGGHIRQAMLSAAHDAVATGEITQAHLIRAVAREYAKLGRSIRREDFQQHFAVVRGQA